MRQVVLDIETTGLEEPKEPIKLTEPTATTGLEGVKPDE